MLVVRWDDAPPRPWKNGGGSTRELRTWPPGATTEDFDWRVSVADITAAADFSRFPGVRRRTAALQGAVVLVIDGQPFQLSALNAANATAKPMTDPSLSYDGDAAVRCEAPSSMPTRLLNVMTRWPDFDCVLTWGRSTEDKLRPGLLAEFLLAAPRGPEPAEQALVLDPTIRIQIVRGCRR
jgi:environmental stress-induced protein Ves